MVAFKKILFPTDFLASEKPALLSAIHLAGLHKGEVLVQHVVNDDIERFAHAAVASAAGEIRKHMELAAESEIEGLVARMAGSVPIRPVLSRGRVAEEICALADEEGVDLIVMGAAAGPVTGKVIRLTARPVLAFPSASGTDAAAEGFKLQGILVATDFSERSTNIVRYAFELRKIFEVSLHLLYVIETSRAIEFAVTHGQLAHTVEKMKEWALHELRSLIPAEFAGDPRVVLHVERGSVSQNIAALARDIGGCLTILGNHRHGLAHPHLLGTTTGRLLASMESPVLTLKL